MSIDYRWTIIDADGNTKLNTICETQQEAEAKLQKRRELVGAAATGRVCPVLIIPVIESDSDSEARLTVGGLIQQLATLDQDKPITVYQGDDFGRTQNLCQFQVWDRESDVHLG